MSLTLTILCVCLLHLVVGAPKTPIHAREASRNGGQYYGNATDLITLQDLETPFPYDFPDHGVLDNLFPMPSCNDLVLEEATVDYLRDAMNKGRLTSTRIALCYLQRIYQTNGYAK